MRNAHQYEKAYLQDQRKTKIAIAGTGYVGLSLSVLLAQQNAVKAVVSAGRKSPLSVGRN